MKRLTDEQRKAVFAKGRKPQAGKTGRVPLSKSKPARRPAAPAAAESPIGLDPDILASHLEFYLEDHGADAHLVLAPLVEVLQATPIRQLRKPTDTAQQVRNYNAGVQQAVDAMRKAYQEAA